MQWKVQDDGVEDYTHVIVSVDDTLYCDANVSIQLEVIERRYALKNGTIVWVGIDVILYLEADTKKHFGRYYFMTVLDNMCWFMGY